MKGSDIFGKNAFKDVYLGVYEYDPLYGKNRYYQENKYYFVLLDCNQAGMFDDWWNYDYKTTKQPIQPTQSQIPQKQIGPGVWVDMEKVYIGPGVWEWQ